MINEELSRQAEMLLVEINLINEETSATLERIEASAYE